MDNNTYNEMLNLACEITDQITKYDFAVQTNIELDSISEFKVSIQYPDKIDQIKKTLKKYQKLLNKKTAF